jgi:hypothetical protein
MQIIDIGQTYPKTALNRAKACECPSIPKPLFYRHLMPYENVLHTEVKPNDSIAVEKGKLNKNELYCFANTIVGNNADASPGSIPNIPDQSGWLCNHLLREFL